MLCLRWKLLLCLDSRRSTPASRLEQHSSTATTSDTNNAEEAFMTMLSAPRGCSAHDAAVYITCGNTALLRCSVSYV
eukprot:1117-Heterococcus_DN1.PRE.11